MAHLINPSAIRVISKTKLKFSEFHNTDIANFPEDWNGKVSDISPVAQVNLVCCRVPPEASITELEQLSSRVLVDGGVCLFELSPSRFLCFYFPLLLACDLLYVILFLFFCAFPR